jgi:hypothetical protein
MMRRIARIATNRVATITASPLLAAAALVALPSAPASASSSIVAWWTSGGAVSCDAGGPPYPY